MGVLGPGTSSIITQSFKILSILENHKLPSFVNFTQNLYLQHSLIKGKSDGDTLGKAQQGDTSVCTRIQQKRWLYEAYAETQNKMAEKAGENLELLEALQRVKSWAGGNRSSHLFHSDGFSCFTPP